MATTPAKLSEVLSIRVTENLHRRLRVASDKLGERPQDIARAGIRAELERLETAKSDAEVTELLARCTKLGIDPKGALHTAIIEEQCSSIQQHQPA